MCVVFDGPAMCCLDWGETFPKQGWTVQNRYGRFVARERVYEKFGGYPEFFDNELAACEFAGILNNYRFLHEQTKMREGCEGLGR